MRKIFCLLAVALISVTSCIEKTFELPWEPVTPKEEEEPGPQEEPGTQEDPWQEIEITGKPRYVWIDASANFRFYANDAANIASDVKKIKEAGFTDIIVDVRPTEGTVLFSSTTAPATKRLAAWVNSSYKFVERTASFDYLQAFIDAGHKEGLRVNAAINTFVCGYGGLYGLSSEGPIFLDSSSPYKVPTSWATTVNYSTGVASSFRSDVQGTVFMNPVDPDVQNYVLKIIAELARYNLDGIILDRCRFDDEGLGSDFSNLTKEKFADYLGAQPSKWPVFNAGTSNLPAVLTKEQKAWMSFRVKVIHDFVERAAKTVHNTNGRIRFGCYVGAWYESYFSSGVNWASPKHTNCYSWADSEYHKYGYADHCDFMMLGCYAAAQSIYGTTEWTMQGFCTKARNLLCGDTVFAGGPDIGNPTGWPEGGQGAKIPQTIDACINAADGYFVFDLCHIRMYDYWQDFKKGFDDYLKSL